MNSLVLQRVTGELRAVRNAVRKLSRQSTSIDERQLQTKINFFLDEVEMLISRTRSEISKMENSKVGLEKEILDDYYEKFAEIARDTLYEEIAKACDNSEEFGREPYRGALLSITRDPRIANVFYFGELLQVMYLMDEVAGTRWDYFRAVEAASLINREETPTEADPDDYLKLERVRQGERMSDLFWEEKIYNATYNAEVIAKYSGAYERIVSLRFSEMNSPAPFWSLLDQGNVSPRREAGGRGEGKPYPIQKPTHFVMRAEEKAEKRISSAINKDKKIADEAIDRNIESLNNAIENYNFIFEELLAMITNIELGIQQRFIGLREAIYNRAMDNISKSQKAQKLRFTNEMKSSILAKSEETAYKIMAGMPVDQAYLGTYGGSKRTRGYQVRVRTIDLVREVERTTEFAIVDGIENITENLLDRISSSVEKYKAIRDFARRILGRGR